MREVRPPCLRAHELYERDSGSLLCAEVGRRVLPLQTLRSTDEEKPTDPERVEARMTDRPPSPHGEPTK